MVIDPRDLFKRSAAVEDIPAPLGGTRSQLIQRLQVGVLGLAAMVLMVALADIVITRARETEAQSVPEASPVAAIGGSQAPRDPLADAGVVPDLPADPAIQAGLPPQEAGDVQPPVQPR